MNERAVMSISAATFNYFKRTLKVLLPLPPYIYPTRNCKKLKELYYEPSVFSVFLENAPLYSAVPTSAGNYNYWGVRAIKTH